ncbi:MAG: HAD family hydrolase [Candidatus Magasanikbacteria bacterium]|nr:HAD family hydrolase [Candidatus Magasanikbacteria bacterium]
MIKYDVCFVDLDDTIYDTRKLKEDIYKLFQPFGINHEQFIKAYRRAAELPTPGYFHYTFEKQIEAVREFGYEVSENILNDLNNLLNNDYLLSDAGGFIRYLKTICAKVILLTAGTIEFQKRKVEAIGADKMFDEVVQIAGGKDQVIASIVKNEKILFINDNLEENMVIKNHFAGVDVLTLYNYSYWNEEDCERSKIPWFKSLNDIKNYLQSK